MLVSNAVIAEGLAKAYGSVRALDGLDLAVPEGSVLALLGPNGAGKTTCVRVLTTLLQPDAGRAEVAGIDVLRRPRDVRKVIGLSGQYAAVDEYLTGYENLDMIGRLYHLGRSKARARALELLEQFRLDDAADRPVKTYSGGMRRRLDLAGALVARPQVLFLDEPTTGLDPRSRTDMWQVLGRPRRRRHHRAAHDAVPGGGRPAGGRDRRRRPRPGHRPRHVRRAEGPGGRRGRRGRRGRPPAGGRRGASAGGRLGRREPVGGASTPARSRSPTREACRRPRCWSSRCASSTPKASRSGTSPCAGRLWTTCSSP